MTFTKKFTAAIATGAVLVNAVAPAAFAAEISGNGAFSDNTVRIQQNSENVVSQSNEANVVNNVNSSATTGGNKGSFNTGGETIVVTGNAKSVTDINNSLNTNHATVSNCGTCAQGETDVTISGNGAFSDNKATVDANKQTFLNQTNVANVRNDVKSNADTGKNDASFNTGGEGSQTVISTGKATTGVSVTTDANKNVAVIGGGNGSANESSILIKGNGAFSDNKAKLSQNSAVVLDQSNVANVRNDIEADANTGRNDAGFNTGGITGIYTGNATTAVSVDNAVNFNAASLDCECIVSGVDAKIAGNGAESKSRVYADSDNALFNDQVNAAHLANNVDDSAKSGKNDVSFSTGDVDGDPFISTGNATSGTTVSNEGNSNVFTQGSHFDPSDYDFDIDFDLHSLWLSLNHWMWV